MFEDASDDEYVPTVTEITAEERKEALDAVSLQRSLLDQLRMHVQTPQGIAGADAQRTQTIQTLFVLSQRLPDAPAELGLTRALVKVIDQYIEWDPTSETARGLTVARAIFMDIVYRMGDGTYIAGPYGTKGRLEACSTILSALSALPPRQSSLASVDAIALLVDTYEEYVKSLPVIA